MLEVGKPIHEPETAGVKDVVGSSDPRAVIWDLLRAQWRFSGLYAFVQLDLAGYLGDGPLTIRELAQRCGADEMALFRLMRTAASMGIVSTVTAEDGPAVYALTAAGHTLRGDVDRSMRSVAIIQGIPAFLDAMGSLADAVRSGRSGFAAQYGSFYGFLKLHPDIRQHFNTFMVSRSRAMAEAVVDAYDFTGIPEIADIGGGNGCVLATILQANPGVRGVLLDVEAVIPGARDFLTAEGVADRCDLVTGDFFADVPRANTYLLSNIVHNWNDDDALTILQNVLTAMPEDGRVLFLDMLLPEGDEPHLGKEMDMRLLALYDGGRERGREEYISLLAKAGLSVRRIFDLPYALSLIEAFPAESWK